MNNQRFITTLAAFAAAVFCYGAFGADVYVSTAGNDANDGSSSAPFATLTKAIETLGASGGTVHVAPGTYLSTSGFETSGFGESAYEITAPIEVRGEGANPAATIFRREHESGSFRLFYINHTAAKLKNITIDNGDISNDGGNVYIDANGGTVEDCILSNGAANHWNGGGGNVYMVAGRVIRCKLTGGSCRNERDPPTTDWHYGAAIMATGGVVENCLITGNGIHGNTGGNRGSCAVNLIDGAQLLNCTVAGNFGVYCAGVYVQRTTSSKPVPVVRNCAIFNNTATTDQTGHSADWMTQNDACNAAFVGCACKSTINNTCVTAVDGKFVDPGTGDYHLTYGSVCRDAATDYASSGAVSDKDLDGKSRKMGSREDIGCYEFDTSVLNCDFSADITEGLIPCKVTFTASFSGDGVTSVTYEWDIDGDGIYDTAPSASGVLQREFDAVGFRTIGLRVKSATQTATAKKGNYLYFGAPHVYVNASSTGGVSPYDTPDKAAKDLKTAYPVTANGSVIHIAPGLYEQSQSTRVADIERAVTIIGDDGDPANTVLRNTTSPESYVDASIIKLNHPGAVLANVTLKDGCSRNVGSIGSSVTIMSGGTITNCIITGGRQLHNLSAPTAGVLMQSGLLTHSILEDFQTPLLSEADGFLSSPNSRIAQALAITGPATVQNCLFRNSISDGPIVVLDHDDAVMRNCSIVDCEVSFWTDNPADISDSNPVSVSNPRKQHATAAIDSVNGKGMVYNTVFFNVKRRAYTDMRTKIFYPEVACKPFTRSSNTDTDSGDSEEDPRCIGCASNTGSPINAKCVKMAAGDFVDYAGGDFTPRLGGAINDAGTAISGWTRTLDLAGHPRVIGMGIDIGCYEQQDSTVTARDIYVDCTFTGTGNGTRTNPYKTIREGCAAAVVPGSRVFVRGGTSRLYTFNSCADAAELGTDNCELIGCDDAWSPATGYDDPEAMVTLAISDAYADTSYTIRNSASFESPLVVNGLECRVSGFRSEFGSNSFRSTKGGDGLINVLGSGAVIECCWFKGAAAADGNAGARGVVFGGRTQDGYRTQETVIRNCYVWLSSGGFLFFDLQNGTRVENCLVENLASLYFSDNQEEGVNYYIISNVFLNCASLEDRQLLGNAGNNMPAGGEIAYNRAVHDAGVPGWYVFIQHGYQLGGNWDGDLIIHHNTLVNYDIAFMKNYLGGGYSQELSRAQNERYCWSPKIFDNLLVNVKTNIWECSVGLFADDNKSSFKYGATFYNNAFYNTEFLGGPATEFDWYDLKDLVGTNTTIFVDSAPMFVNTTNPKSDGYLKLKVPTSPWVLNAWTGLDPTFPEFPRYIGAVEPQPGGFAVRIR